MEEKLKKIKKCIPEFPDSLDDEILSSIKQKPTVISFYKKPLFYSVSSFIIVLIVGIFSIWYFLKPDNNQNPAVIEKTSIQETNFEATVQTDKTVYNIGDLIILKVEITEKDDKKINEGILIVSLETELEVIGDNSYSFYSANDIETIYFVLKIGNDSAKEINVIFNYTGYHESVIEEIHQSKVSFAISSLTDTEISYQMGLSGGKK